MLVGQRVIINCGANRGFHVLPAFKTVKRRVRLQTDATDCRIQLPQTAGGAPQRAAGAEPGDKMRDASPGLFPNFVRRAAIMGLPVRRSAVFIAIKVFLPVSSDYFFDAANRAVGALIRPTDD